MSAAPVPVTARVIPVSVPVAVSVAVAAAGAAPLTITIAVSVSVAVTPVSGAGFLGPLACAPSSLCLLQLRQLLADRIPTDELLALQMILRILPQMKHVVAGELHGYCLPSSKCTSKH